MVLENPNIKFYRHLEDQFPYISSENIILFYCGEINHEIIKSLLYTSESFFKRANISRALEKKVFNILVECIQNIEKHSGLVSENPLLTYKKGAIALANFTDNIQVFSMNVVNEQQKQFLLKKETEIKGKNKDELRELYKNNLINSGFNERGGAGLGFIDMARKTNNQLFFYFKELTDNLSLYTLQVIINK
jgi:hypothetical protein